MGVDVNTLTLDPASLSQGKNKVTITFNGVVDGSGDNPVALKFTIDPNSPAYFIIGARKVKVLTASKNFDAPSDEYSVDAIIEVTAPYSSDCGFELEATDNTGETSVVDQIFYIS
jgi:hypothetical protein